MRGINRKIQLQSSIKVTNNSRMPCVHRGECKTSYQTSWVFSPEEAKKNNYRTVKVTDIVIYNLKGSFNTKRFVGPILDSQGSLFWTQKNGQFTFRVESFIDGKIEMQKKTVNWT